MNFYTEYKLFIVANVAYLLSFIENITPYLQFAFLGLSIILAVLTIAIKLKELFKKKD